MYRKTINVRGGGVFNNPENLYNLPAVLSSPCLPAVIYTGHLENRILIMYNIDGIF